MRQLLTSALVLALGADPAGAQAVLDWPLLLEARPAALVGGAGAALSNPATLPDLHGRAEALVSDLETPDEMGLHALTVASAVRVYESWTIGAAYRHVGVGDMLLTDGPPLGGPGGTPTPTFEVAEDVYALGVGARFGVVSAGLAARADTPADDLGGPDRYAGIAGVAVDPPLPFVDARVAGALEIESEGPAFDVALEVRSEPLLDRQLVAGLAYGAEHEDPLGLSHRLVGSVAWRGMAELQGGAAGQAGSGETAWVPMFAGLVHLGRYRLGIVREHLPNGFGAAMHYRLSIVF